jgi:oxygen-independent coproporphyrinogen-3 oxidase
MFHFNAPPPLSLYIHFPWCVRKCPYCDFNSHAVRGDIPEDQYVDALLADLESDLPRVWGRPVRSVFLGGGTPSLFSPEAIERLLAGVRARVTLVPEAEITLEANPGTIAAPAHPAPATHMDVQVSREAGSRERPAFAHPCAAETERFRGYRTAGVNRLSIGVQSFQPGQLQKLGRIHGRDEAIAAAQAARAAGFDNFNLDLMFGLPQQTLEEALADLRTALSLNPTHLSLYQLTLEPNTIFHAQPPELPDEDVLAAMQETLQAELAIAGFSQYEVSAYARAGQEPKCREAHGCASVTEGRTPGAAEAHGSARVAAGHRCRHNLNYWQFGDYLGIGAGAHAKITAADTITRLWKLKQPRDYLATAGTPGVLGGEHQLAKEDVAFEFMLNVLRLTEGFPPMLFAERAGLPFAEIETALARAMARGLVEQTHERIRPTALGLRFLNDLIALFLPEGESPSPAGRHKH